MFYFMILKNWSTFIACKSLVTTLATIHTGSVDMMALFKFMTVSTRYAAIYSVLSFITGLKGRIQVWCNDITIRYIIFSIFFFYIYSTHKLSLQSFLINLVISLFLKTWKHKLINIHFKETMIIQLYYFSMLLYRWFLIIDFKICILD